MSNEEILIPIETKIAQWIEYEKNKPECSYKENSILWDNYRKKNDLDCQLMDNQLNADTIFSLWLPLRFTLVNLNAYSEFKYLGKLEKSVYFLNNLKDNLSRHLPINKPVVKKLSKLFELGVTRANVMIMPEIGVNGKRGGHPYYDYMPYFLYECFKDGDFSQYFKYNDEILKKWIEDEKLKMFFEDEQITKNKIKDLADTGNVKKGVPLELEKLEKMLDRYIEILEIRGNILR